MSLSRIPHLALAQVLLDLQEVHVRVKVGGEGASVFDSATATLQGLFPPNEKNRITLANETTVVAPLGGTYPHDLN